MINFEKFYESGNFQGDFLISTHRSEALDEYMENLKFDKMSTGFGCLYTHGFPLPARSGVLLFSGISRVDKKIVYGPFMVEKSFTPHKTGEYYLVSIEDDIITVKSDFFGLTSLYYGNGFVSNRLQLIFMAMKVLGYAKLVNPDIFFTNFMIANVFTLQLSTYDTIVNNVKKLPREKYLTVSCEGISVLGEITNFSIITCDEYYSHIERAAQEITDYLDSILNSFTYPQCALTGGRDSRVIFAALVAMGKIKDVQLITSDSGHDQEIASGLVKRYGGSYDNIIRAPSVIVTDRVDNLEKFISRYFFTKLYIPFFDLSEYLAGFQEKTCFFGGGSAEVFRDCYQKYSMIFGSDFFDRDLCETFFKKTYWLSRGFSNAFPYILSTFYELPGETVSQKLLSHFTEFRNVYHFGNKSNKLNRVSLDPLTSLHLYFASRGLPDSVRDSGRIFFDITRQFVEEMAYTQYDSPSLDYSKLSYHKKSRYDGSFFSVEPDKSICLSASSHKKFAYRNVTVSDQDLFTWTVCLLHRLVENVTNSSNFLLRGDNTLSGKIDFYVKRRNSHAITKCITSVLEALLVEKYL